MGIAVVNALLDCSLYAFGWGVSMELHHRLELVSCNWWVVVLEVEPEEDFPLANRTISKQLQWLQRQLPPVHR